MISWARYGETFAYDEDSGVKGRPLKAEHVGTGQLAPLLNNLQEGHTAAWQFGG
jgi:hypothetical protein